LEPGKTQNEKAGADRIVCRESESSLMLTERSLVSSKERRWRRSSECCIKVAMREDRRKKGEAVLVVVEFGWDLSTCFLHHHYYYYC